jgi:TPR repeat protein
MTHAVRFVAVVAVLTALALCVPVQAQTPEQTDALRARAEAGDAEAQNLLGVMYDYGEGVPQDYAVAARWHRLAADQGHAEAQYQLGGRYWRGQGVPQDYVQAHMWYSLAASRLTGGRRHPAVRERDRVAGLMTSAQIAEAQRLAREFDAAHPREP